MGERQNNKTTTLVLIGKTGNGKSATANSILGRKDFLAKLSWKSVTKECKLSSSVWKDGDGRTLNVVDTPGLFDTNADQQFVANEITKCIKLAKDGVHGVLYVVSLKNRFTDEEAAVFEWLQIMFGPRITDYMVIVFTWSDLLEETETFEDYFNTNEYPKTLKDLLRKCNNRMVLFNNKSASPTKKIQQVKELLKQVDSVVDENGGKAYSDEMFHKFQGMTRAFLNQPASSPSSPEQTFLQVFLTVEKRMEKLQEQLDSERNSRRDADSKAEKLKKEVDELRGKGRCIVL